MPKSIQLLTLIDRSGSMAGKVKDTVGAYNAFIEGLVAKDVKAKAALATFDNRFELVYSETKLSKVEPVTVTTEAIQPRGSTALYDAIAKLCSLGDKEKPCMVTIISDGGENASHEMNQAAAQRIVKECEKAGWEFQFIGMDIDAKTAASGMRFARSAYDGSAAMGATTLDTIRGDMGDQGPIGTKAATYFVNATQDKKDDKDSQSPEIKSGISTSSVD